jgi:periplasmic protein TonB
MRPYSIILFLALLTACTQPETLSEETDTQTKDTTQVRDTTQLQAPADTMPDVDTTAMQLPTIVPPVEKEKIRPPELVERKLPEIEEEPVHRVENWVDLEGPPSAAISDEPANSKVFMFVEEMPEFRSDLTTYLKEHIRYPEVARTAGTEGKVTVQFIVTRDGEVTGVSVVRGIDKEIDNEALRVFNEMPKNSWRPGKQNGKAVNVRMTVPVMFKLPE